MVFPGSRAEGADLEMPWSTAACAHWKAQYSQLGARRFPECNRVGPIDPVYSLMLVSPVHVPPEESTDDTPLHYPLGSERQQPSQQRLAAMAVGQHGPTEGRHSPQE